MADHEIDNQEMGFAAASDDVKRRMKEENIVERNGAYYITVDGVEYPLGLEPDPNMSEHDLYIAQQKEKVFAWMFRIGLIGLAILIIMIVLFSTGIV